MPCSVKMIYPEPDFPTDAQPAAARVCISLGFSLNYTTVETALQGDIGLQSWQEGKVFFSGL
jgi:hypothetical protein